MSVPEVYVGSVLACPAGGPSLSFHVKETGIVCLRYEDEEGRRWEGTVNMSQVHYKCPDCGQENDAGAGELCSKCVKED